MCVPLKSTKRPTHDNALSGELLLATLSSGPAFNKRERERERGGGALSIVYYTYIGVTERRKPRHKSIPRS